MVSQVIGFLKSEVNRSILFNYLKASIVLLLILCIATGVIYGIMNHSLRKEVARVNDILLHNTINALEKEFANLDELVSIIDSNPRIGTYMNMQYHNLSPAGNYNAYEIVKDLRTYVNGNDFIDSIYIFFDNDVIISNTYKVKSSFYFEHLDQGQDRVVDLPNKYSYKRLLYLGGRENDAEIYYVNSLPIGNKKTQKATVVIHINSGMIRDFITSNQLTDKTETTILDFDQSPIVKYNICEEGLRQKDLVINSIKSEIIQIEIVSTTPRIEFEAKLQTLRRTIIYIMLITLSIGMILAIYFSYRNYYPVATLMEIVGQEEMINVNNNIFSNIECNISRIIDENEDLKLRIDRQTELISNNAMEKLVRQEISSEEEIRKVLKMSNIRFESSKFVVYSIKLDIANDSEIDYLKLIDQLETLINYKQKGYVFYMNEYNISILIEVIDEHDCNSIELGESIIQLLNRDNIISTVGIGGYCCTVEDLNKSYREALFALNIAPTTHRGSVIAYESIKDITENKTKYYYPIEIEQEIINSVRAGDIVKVQRLLEEVYNENFKEIQLSGQISRILVSNMVSTVIKIMDDLEIDLTKFEETNILAQLYNAERVNDVYSSLIETYTIICNLVNKNKRSHNRCLFDEIEEYLRREFRNQQISLGYVASQFNLSESYLSRFFKEQSGVNFNDYIQQLRVEEAKELFMEGDNILVKEVALEVGYNNTGGLIRAFNKYEGITPGEYRSKHM